MKQVNCDLCGSKNIYKLYTTRRKVCNDNYYFDIVECKSCGLVYTNPQPELAEIKIFYPEDSYYSFQDYKKSDSKKLFQRIKLKLQKLVLEECYGWRKKQQSVFTQLPKRIIALLLEKTLGHAIPYKENGKLLDIGCGNGAFLAWVKEMSTSWDLFGMEISKKAIDYVKENIGANVFCGMLSESKYPDNYFDVITMWDVLEHIPIHSQPLLEITRILKKDGVLLLTLPNFDCLPRKIFKGNWFSLQIPEHIYHFRAKTITMMLKKYGFKNITINYLNSGNPLGSWKILKKENLFWKILLYPLCLMLENIYSYGHMRITAVNSKYNLIRLKT